MKRQMNFMGKLVWYIRRLSVMSAKEIVYRVSQQLMLRWMHMMYMYYGGCIPRRSPDYLSHNFCNSAKAVLPELSWKLNYEEALSQYADGAVDALGIDFQWQDSKNIWHVSPDTKNTWPREFFAAIPYRSGNPYGDARIVWEPSRLQNLVTLALLVNSSEGHESERLIDLLERQFITWCDDNPLWCGIHYVSSMECALRIISVSHALDMVRSKLKHPETVWQAYSELVDGHARLIMSHLSLYSSTGNHTVAECSGLVYAGLLFPEMERSQVWLETGLDVLSKEAERQILSDGGGVEQAVWYHLFVMDLYGLVCGLLKSKGHAVPQSIEHALKRGAEFLHAFGSDPNELFIVGDSDSGFALSKYLRNSWDGITDDSSGCHTFLESGYTLIKNHGPAGIKLLFDHGTLGMQPSFGHGHADALSLCIDIGSEQLMIDPGTYTYTGNPEWRSYFRSTRAHNTIVVDGKDQSIQKGAFMWSQPFHARLIESYEDDKFIMLLAEHDGYSNLGVTHLRGVLWKKTGGVLVLDFVHGDGEHEVELNWHMNAQSCDVDRDNELLELSGKGVTMKVSGGGLSLKSAEVKPISGWKSTIYGVKEPIVTANCSYNGSLPHEFATTINLAGKESGVEDSDLSRLRKWVNEHL